MLSQDQPSTSSSSNVVLDFDDLPEDVLDILDIPMPSAAFHHNENVLVYNQGRGAEEFGQSLARDDRDMCQH